MLDLKLVRQDVAAVEAKLKSKDPKVSLAPILEMDERIRVLKVGVEELKASRNSASKMIGQKKRAGEDATDVMAEVAGLGDKIQGMDEELRELESALRDALGSVPNLPMDGVKVALDPAENVCVKTQGVKPEFAFKAKNHVELNEKLELFDFERGAKISGRGWPVYKGNGARLEWALLNYMIDSHVENGLEFCMVPHCVRPETMFGSAQLPKFRDQLFKLEDDLYLIPTSEVPLMGLHSDEIFNADDLPKKYVTYTPCFRREAGAAGAGERGLIRMHQFNKVEMFSFCKPEDSTKIFGEMVASAEMIVKGLGLHYKIMELVTGDMSFAAAKTIDLEVWLPGQDRYYEVSSISNCTDFQARRSKTRFRHKDEKPELVHTLNGSGVATSRLMVALLENYQREDGSVELPAVLHKYFGAHELQTHVAP